MRIWRLSPVDSSDPAWDEYDTDPMFVRAKSADRAQDLVLAATLRFRQNSGYQKIEFNPWGRYTTLCEDVTEITEHSPDGPAEVLQYL
jgi:hypothetical protein